MPEQKTVAYLGEPYSFHYLAAEEFFGSEVKLIPQKSFDLIINAVKKGEVNFGIIAADNSLAGNITDKNITNLQRICELELIICAETYFHVNLHLATLKQVPMKEIETVISHPVAIRESSLFLKKHPHIKTEEINSTAGGIKKIADLQLENSAAIGNRKAIEQYGLVILQENIDNHPDNFTRFFIITTSKNQCPQTTIQKPKASLLIAKENIGHAEIIVHEHKSVVSKKEKIILGESEFCYLEVVSRQMKQMEEINFILMRKGKNTRVLGVYENEKDL